MNLQDWLTHLQASRAFRMELGLHRVQEAVHDLALLPNDKTKVITVAGTNGKGSTVAVLESCAMAAGWAVASFTSPHLIDFNERIRINGQPVANELICQAFVAINQYEKSSELTYFEWTFLAALFIYKQTPLTLIILEVGLGGRLDATNVIDSDVAVITSIALDHTQHLGDTREKIATEKAGIMRKNHPVICGDSDPPETLFQHAKDLNCPLKSIAKDFSYNEQAEELQFTFSFGKTFHLPKSTLIASNIAIAIEALYAAFLPISEEIARLGLKQIYIPARRQWLEGDINHLFDVAHNPASITKLAEFIKQKQCQRVHIIFAMRPDKDFAQCISTLSKVITGIWHIAPTEDKNKQAMSEMKEILVNNGVYDYQEFDTILDAYKNILEKASSQETIVICGSFITVGKVMQQFNQLDD